MPAADPAAVSSFRAAAEPLVAWRYWQLSPRRLLRSVSQRRVEWLPAVPLLATCLGGGHRAPSPGCNCGVYGARDLDSLREHGLCLAPEPLVVGQVALWGTMIMEDHAYRADSGYPLRLSLVADTLEGDHAEVVAQLERYGVPVDLTTLDAAVAGVSAVTLRYQVLSARASRALG